MNVRNAAFGVLVAFLTTASLGAVVRDDAVPGCLGEPRSMIVSSQMPYAITRVGDLYGFFVIDTGTDESTISPAAFLGPTKPRPIAGSLDRFERFDFFGPWKSVRLRVQDNSYIRGIVAQGGLIGTDILSLDVYTIDYARSLIYRAPRNGFCSDAALRKAGFVEASTDGYYASDAAAVTCPGKGDSHCPNVPTVAIRIGTAVAAAQIDTGFDDGLFRHSINVNSAFFELLRRSNVQLVLVPDGSMDLGSCVAGVRESVDRYRLPAGTAVEFVGAGGKTVRSERDAMIFVKKTPAALKQCGGIGTWSLPAAQLGASFFAAEEALIVDPFTSKVWFKLKQ